MPHLILDQPMQGGKVVTGQQKENSRGRAAPPCRSEEPAFAWQCFEAKRRNYPVGGGIRWHSDIRWWYVLLLRLLERSSVVRRLHGQIIAQGVRSECHRVQHCSTIHGETEVRASEESRGGGARSARWSQRGQRESGG